MDVKQSFAITHEVANGWVRVELTGPITVETVVAMATAAVDVGRKHDCRYWIVDYTQTQALDSTIDIFGFSSRLDRVGIEQADIIAIVVASDLEKHAFAETVSYNRGYPNLQYFHDMESAEAWIKKRQEDPG
jgi:hypothetical protein